MNIAYQNYYLEQIKKHKKSILIWFRQSGKSSLIVNYVADYILENKNKKIYIHSQHQNSSQNLMKKFGKLNISINNNIVKFKSDNKYKGETPDVIIYDDFEFLNHADLFSNMLDRWKPKIILTSSQFTTELITYFDRNGDYYLSVVSASSVLPFNSIEERKSVLPSGAYNVSHEYGNIEELYSGLGIKKDRNLIDVWGLKNQRRRNIF